MTINKEELFRKTIEKWGKRFQFEMAQEEATELALACRRYIRNPSEETLTELVTEVADVEIMIEQLKIMLPIKGSVYLEKQFKLDRLENRITNNQYEDE